MKRNHRINFERTCDLVNKARRLIDASYAAAEEIPCDRDHLAKFDCLFVMLSLAIEKFDEIDKSLEMEWAGLGGNSPSLTESEKQLARGETDDHPRATFCK